MIFLKKLSYVFFILPGTGIGTCQIGGASNPLVKAKTGHSHIQWVPANTCNPESTNKSWHFTSCPDCMCNGHSSCTKDPMNCDQPCQNNTEGEHCEKCAKGYFGSPVNGGVCDGCECNGQAEECHHKTGRCHCTTKGIIGEKCQKCDTVNHYFGNPKDGGSCYCKFIYFNNFFCMIIEIISILLLQ